VGHPAVESLTYWGIADEGSWLGAPSGLVRLDGPPKPAHDALHDLIRGEWWLSSTEMVTDADGRVTVEGFGGEYLVSAAGAGGAVTVRAGDNLAADVVLG
jgi:hypothetical protein